MKALKRAFGHYLQNVAGTDLKRVKARTLAIRRNSQAALETCWHCDGGVLKGERFCPRCGEDQLPFCEEVS